MAEYQKRPYAADVCMNTLSKENIEHLAVAYLENAIAEHPLMISEIKTNDNALSWDGFIKIYSANSHSKDSLIGRIPIQLKGTSIKCWDDKGQARFSISRRDLKNYLKDYGVLFFLVFANGAQRTLYYTALLPLDIRRLLKNKSKTVRVHLDKFPLDNTKKFYIMRSFLYNRKLQANMNNNISSLVDLTSRNINFTGVALSFMDTSLNDIHYLSSLKQLLNEKTYMYAIQSKDVYLPLDTCKIGAIDILVEDATVSVGNTVFYNTYKTHNSNVLDEISFGNDDIFTLNFSEPEHQIHHFIHGSLPDRILAYKFILAASDNKGFSINNNFLGMASLDENNYSYYATCLNNLTLVRDTLDKLNIKYTNYDVSQLTQNQWILLCSISDAIINNRPCELPTNQDAFYRNEVLGDICILYSAKSTGIKYQYTISSFNDKDGYYKCTVLDNINGVSKTIRVSPYKLFTTANYTCLSEKGYNEVYDSVMKYFSCTRQYNESLLIVLEMIKAFDITSDNYALNTAEKIIDNLINIGHLPDIMLINKLQINKRKRMLDDNERNKLIDLKYRTDNEMLRISAEILLDNFNDAEHLLSNLSDDDLLAFRSFPIYNLLNNKNIVSDQNEPFKNIIKILDIDTEQ
jgi:hypothetical protein